MLARTEARMRVLLLTWLAAFALLPFLTGCVQEDYGDVRVSGDMTTTFGMGKGMGGVTGGNRVRTGIDF